MKLKKLELYGFKSFADRTAFEFEDSLSALVGPNGSGKSNVVDAIKWVLGERSAQKLRGAEMANLIFDGGKSRKPLSFAEVKLTIDNADGWLPVDYEEVCIARKTDRTGQSEYSLNGQQCRLKDIRHLLLDTGVGTSSYSFIEQGQIDQLLRASASERRQVFEEAAGINRFLEQKREAERKLERVGQNLLRVGDLIEELQRQLRSVKYQAGRARTFKKQTEQLQRLRLADGLHSLRRMQAEAERLSAEIEAVTARKAELTAELAAAGEGLEAARDELQRTQDGLAESRQRLARVEARLESLAREAELSARRAEELDGRLAELDGRRRELQQRLEGLEREAGEAEAGRDECARELAAGQAELEARRTEIERLRAACREAEQGLEARKSEVFDLFQQDAHLRNQIEVLGAEKRALQNRLQRVEERRGKLSRQVDETAAERARAQQNLEAVRARQGELRGRAEEVGAALADAERRLEDIDARRAEAKAELSGKAARRDLLRDLERRGEGVGSGVRRLIEAALGGRVGLVAEQIDAPLELAPAVEAALGPAVQAVIFGGTADAVAALDALGAEPSGRVELIVLDRLPPRREGGLGLTPGLEGPLSGMVGCTQEGRPAVERLLGGAYLCEDRSRALALARAGLPDGIVLVTPQGERFGADGTWAAGAPEAAGLISRRSELAALDAEVEHLRDALAGLGERREAVQAERVELAKRAEALEGRAAELARSAGEVQSHLRVVGERGRELREELHLGQAEADSLRSDVADIESRSAELARRAEEVRRERSAAQNSAEADQERLREMQQRRQAVAEELSALASELARSREQQRALEDLAGRLGADARRARAELESLAGESESGLRRRDEARRAAEAARAEGRRLEAEKAALSEALQSESAGLQAVRERIDALAARSQELAEAREAVEERLGGLRIAENETTVKMQDMLERVAEDYGVRLEALRRDPESWREESPFTARPIREFTEEAAEPEPAEPVAAWFREADADGQGEEEEQPPEPVSLEEAVELRRAVIEMADDEATDWGRVRSQIARLKAKVDRVGNVNVAAIRQQEELEVRLQFLTDQKEDLESARRHQREIIRELNKKSRERFRETFEQVRQNFQALFRKLFGGGSADLLLDEEAEDVLEAGVEMVARPPGKETSCVTLLSGGERALTTLALLFAMFQAKPSPFCLLDEVDAPLDDSNVERFLMLLGEFRRDTQFVIITHNKITMSVAQVLYGLTMADGVSKKIAVKFEEVDRSLDQAA